MNLKTSVCMALSLILFFGGIAEAAYDLPKVKVEKKSSNKADSKKEKVIKSDWTEFAKFEERIKTALIQNPDLSPSAPERIGEDKNLVFVAFYKDMAYFLDKYSIKIIGDGDGNRIWEQHIFPIGEKISSKNTRVTVQTFRFENQKIYNSSRRKNELNDVSDAEDRIFLKECFKVGYYYTFKEEVDLNS